MSRTEVLLVAGTHGNEINACWFLNQVFKKSELQEKYSFNISTVIGNPLAFEKGVRYIDRDLNRSFSSRLLSEFSQSREYEVKRAKELIDLYGSHSKKPCQIVLDFHSTTAAMGTCIVIYGRRSNDLALASLIQSRLGIPIYLHEGDDEQIGFLVEKWPCGLVVEIGPVAQGLLDYKIIRSTSTVLETCLDEIQKIKNGDCTFPMSLDIHKHLGSIDFPRDSDGNINGIVHPQIQGKDWIPITKGQALFINSNGEEKFFNFDNMPESVIPVFINEAAYLEKGIAMSFTTKEQLLFEKSWSEDFYELLA
tara:strand:- start:225 stop:1148 length:924 start_codon:yes stop_codon:yes gene_type:complete